MPDRAINFCAELWSARERPSSPRRRSDSIMQVLPRPFTAGLGAEKALPLAIYSALRLVSVSRRTVAVGTSIPSIGRPTAAAGPETATVRAG